MTKKAVVWVREDFRIEDNEALAIATQNHEFVNALYICLLYTSPSPRDGLLSRMPSSA